MINLNATVVANGLKSDLALDLNRYNFEYRVTDEGDRFLTVSADSPAGNVRVVMDQDALDVLMNVLQQAMVFQTSRSSEIPDA